MQQIVNRFNKGLNKDINKVNFPNDTYYHLQNGRIISDTGNDTFSVVNIEGNVKEIPNNYPDYIIIGYVNVRDDIVLFYAKSDNSGAGKIVLYKWRNDAFTKIELYDNANLKFYESYPIKEDMVVSRYESPEIIKIYWTDNFNKLRYLNIAPDIDTLGSTQDNYTTVNATPLDKLDLVSEINFINPVFNSYTSGSLNSGMIQYAYRLYNLNGSETIFSPASKLIPLTKYSDTNGTQRLRGQSTGGQAFDTNTGKGVVVKIEIDTALVNVFDKIEVVSLWYSDRNGLPNISIIDRKDVTETVYVTDEGGVAEYGTLELETYQALSYDFTCGTLTSKDNRLYAGNINEDYFDIEYDARAFRYFKSTVAVGVSRIYSDNGLNRLIKDNASDTWVESELTSGDIYTGIYSDTGITYTTASIPEDYDCVNLYNVLDYESIISPLVYKQNGTELGGTGVNISYTFEDSLCYKIDENGDTRALNATVTSADGGTISGLNIVANRDWIYGSKRSFHRDEIYRFGIIFFDRKGRASYTKWIGDIRMPSNKDIPSIVSDGTGIYARPMYPIFTVNNIPTIGGEDLDYQIVYVKRNKEDRTIITQGIGGGIIKESATTTFYVSPFEVTSVKNYNDNDFNTITGGAALVYNRNIIEYITPDVNFDSTFNTSATNTLEIAGAVYKEGVLWRDEDNPNWSDGSAVAFNGDKSYQLVRKFSTVLGTDGNTESTDINDFKVLIPGAENTNRTTIDGSTIYNHYVKRFDTGVAHGGFRGTSAIIGIDSIFDEGAGTFVATPEDYVFLFNMKSDVIGYNGNTYEDRLTNSYIPASSLSDGTGTINCYNGDTFICMYDYLRTLDDSSRATGGKMQEVLYFPIETQYNLFYRYDDSYSRIKDLDNDVIRYLNEVGYTDLTEGVDWTDLYLYDTVYSKIDESKLYLPKPLDYSDNGIFDCMIKYSDLKLNSEERDSWLSFKPNNFNEVDSNYGALKSLVNFNDNIFCFQEGGISIAAINRQELISDSVGANLVLGTGGLLDRFSYISTEIGIQGLNKVIKSLQALYWLDLNKRKIYKFDRGIQSLDDLKGLNSWFDFGITNNTVFKGVYDNDYSEVIMTLYNVEPVVETITYVSKPSTVITFNDIVEGTKVFLTLNNTEYVFTATSNSTTGQFFQVKSTLSDTIDEFLISLSNFTGGNYTVTKNVNEVTIDGLVDGLGNFNTKVESASVVTLPQNNISGAGGITVFDFSDYVEKVGSVFYADISGHGMPDKFEILKIPAADIAAAGSPNANGDWPGSTYVVTSSHWDGDIFGLVDGFDSKSYELESDITGSQDSITGDLAKPWFIGNTHNGPNYPYPNDGPHPDLNGKGCCPTMEDEFLADTGLDLPVDYVASPVFEQRIWATGINPGDKILLRVIGKTPTKWSGAMYLANTATSDISGVSVDVITSTETFTTYRRTSYLDATGSNNLLQVVDPEYFNLRKNNRYTIDGISNTKITDVDSTQFTTDKYFAGTVDLSAYAKYSDVYTVAYNEAMQAFTGFYDFTPELYIKFNRGFFTTIDNQTLYRHNVGDYCEFYGIYYDTYIDIVSSNNSSMVKEFNNIEFYSEIYDSGQINTDETVYSVQVENDYQQSEEVILHPMSDTRYILYNEGNNIPGLTESTNSAYLANIRRSIDHWRTAIPRVITVSDYAVGDYNAQDYDNFDYLIYSESASNIYNTYDRIRGPYAKFRLKFVNSNDKRFILNQVSILYQPMIT